MSDPTPVEVQAEARVCELLPDGYIPLGFVVSVKALDGDGDVCLFNTRTSDLTAWEALGMLVCAQDDLRATMRTVEP